MAIGKQCSALALGAVLWAIITAHGVYAEETNSISKPTLLVGAYDPYGTFANDPTLVIEHVYVAWEDTDLSSLATANKYAVDRFRRLLVTIEPWSWSPAKSAPRPADLLNSIMNRQDDTKISAVCSAVNGLNREVTLRFAHEMDLANSRYPWSHWEPAQYIAVYRHFVDVCRPLAPNVRFMWSPRGERNMQAFYPGDTYVDSIGLTVFAYQEYEVGEFGKALSFAERFVPSYLLAKVYGKDIYLAEFGCHGDKKYVHRCLQEVRNSKTDFPQVAGMIYFNEVDTWPWPREYGSPDWRIFSKAVAASSDR